MIKFYLQNNFIMLILPLAIVGVNIGVSASLITSAAVLTNTHVFSLAILEASVIAWVVFTMRHKNQKVVAL